MIPKGLKMKILFPTSECVPFAKTGGLADVCGALPEALQRLGHEVHVVMPLYRQVRLSGAALTPTSIRLNIPLGQQTITLEVWHSKLPGQCPDIHFLRYDPFYDRAELYRSLEGDYWDNDQRYILFCRGVLELGKILGRKWDIIHCHDWHTGLVPVYLKALYAQEASYAKSRSLLTVHNLAYQGFFGKESMELTGLPWSMFTPDGLEFWDHLNFLKAGLVYADWISTVSQTYAREIQGGEMGCSLDGVLRFRSSRLSGIVNGIDTSVWDPATDPFIPEHFSVQRTAKKKAVKQALLAEIGLYPLTGAPLLAMINRLDDQKGLDIFASIIDKIMEQNLQVVILGTGVKRYHDLLLRVKARFPRKLALYLTFDNELAHRIYAGSDMFLMASRYEPCGLGQLISMRYGTIPVARRTGGLADTVSDFDGRRGNGFLFDAYSGEALLAALKRATGIFAQKKIWNRLIKTAMKEDFSWARSALEYQALYQKIKRVPAGIFQYPLKRNM